MAGGIPGLGSASDYAAQEVSAEIAADLGVTGLTDFVPGVNLITLPYTIYNVVQFMQNLFAGVPREAKTLGPADLLQLDTDIRCRMLGDYIIRQYHGGDWVLSSARNGNYNPARYINFLIWLTQNDLMSRYWNGSKGYLDIPPPPHAAYSRHVILGYVGSYYGVKDSFDHYIAYPGATPKAGPPNFADVCQICGWTNPGNYNELNGGQFLYLKLAVSNGALTQEFINEMASQRGQLTTDLLHAYARVHGGWTNIPASQVQLVLDEISKIPTPGLTPANQQDFINGHPTLTPVPNECDLQINQAHTFSHDTESGIVRQTGTQLPPPPPAPMPDHQTGIKLTDTLDRIFKTLWDDLGNWWNSLRTNPRPGPNPNPNPNQNPRDNNNNQQQQQTQQAMTQTIDNGSNADAVSDGYIIIKV